LVDNGTGAGLAPLGELGRDPRLRLVSLPTNVGIAGGHNAAMAQAKGTFIALLDADDVALPRRLETQVTALQADARLGLVSSRALQIDDHGKVIGREFALDGADEQRVFSAYTNPAPAPSYMGRAEVFRRFPFRAEFRFASDYDFIARSAEAWSMRGIPEVLLHYRQHAQQTTAAHYAEQMRDAGAIRLLAARRRSGRPERLDDTLAMARAWTTRHAGLPDVYRDLARHSL